MINYFPFIKPVTLRNFVKEICIKLWHLYVDMLPIKQTLAIVVYKQFFAYITGNIQYLLVSNNVV